MKYFWLIIFSLHFACTSNNLKNDTYENSPQGNTDNLVDFPYATKNKEVESWNLFAPIRLEQKKQFEQADNKVSQQLLDTTAKSSSTFDYLEKFNGLTNCGNTCYMNAVLQVLLHTEDLANLFYFNTNFTDPELSTISNFYKNYYKHTPSSSPFDSLPMVTHRNNFLSSLFREYEQADAAEYISILLDRISEKLDKRKSPLVKNQDLSDSERHYFEITRANHYSATFMSYSIINKLFTSWYKNYVVCKTKRSKPLVSSNFDNNTIIISELSKERRSLQRIANSYFKEEVFNKNELPNCLDGIKAKLGDTKKISPFKLSKYLILQLKRFNFTLSGMTKNDQHIFYSNKLKLVTEDKKNHSYKLYGVVRHHGSFTGGHYTSFIKSPKNNWYQCDDRVCSSVTYDQVMNDKDAYIFFFEKE